MINRVDAPAKRIRRLKAIVFRLDLTLSNEELIKKYIKQGKSAFDLLENFSNEIFSAMEKEDCNLWGIYHTNDLEYCVSYDFAVKIPKVSMHEVWELIDCIQDIEKQLDFRDVGLYTRVWVEFRCVYRKQPILNRIASFMWWI